MGLAHRRRSRSRSPLRRSRPRRHALSFEALIGIGTSSSFEEDHAASFEVEEHTASFEALMGVDTVSSFEVEDHLVRWGDLRPRLRRFYTQQSALAARAKQFSILSKKDAWEKVLVSSGYGEGRGRRYRH